MVECIYIRFFRQCAEMAQLRRKDRKPGIRRVFIRANNSTAANGRHRILVRGQGPAKSPRATKMENGNYFWHSDLGTIAYGYLLVRYFAGPIEFAALADQRSLRDGHDHIDDLRDHAGPLSGIAKMAFAVISLGWIADQRQLIRRFVIAGIPGQLIG